MKDQGIGQPMIDSFATGLFNDAMDLECDNDDIVRTVRLGKKTG